MPCNIVMVESKSECFLSLTFFSGSEEGVFWKRGLFRKVHFLEVLENLEILEILENCQTAENKGESDHSLEILEKLDWRQTHAPLRPENAATFFNKTRNHP